MDVITQATTPRPADATLLAYLKTNALFQAFHETLLRTLLPDMEWVYLREGDYLFRQGDPGGKLYLVYQGSLQVTIKKEDGTEIMVADVGSGKPLGEIQFLSGGSRTASVHARCASELLALPRTAFDRLAERDPALLHQMAEIIRQRLRRDQLVTMLPLLCGPVDPAMLQAIEGETEWVWLPQGEALCHVGDIGDSFFLLISGRLYAVVEDEAGHEKVVGEVRRGEIVGEMSMFTGEPRSASLYAARSSELVKFSKVAFERITARYPNMIMRIVQIIIRRLQQSQSISDGILPPSGLNIAVVPADETTPLGDFTTRLIAALSPFGKTLHLQSDRLDQMLDMPGMAQTPEYAPNNVRLASWLDEQETKYRIIVYETDRGASPWTERCIQRADRILIVSHVAASEPGPMKRLLQVGGKRLNKTHRTLIRLHPDSTGLPSGTRAWLDTWQVDDHYHVRAQSTPDFERLARFLTGNAIGLVLSGGGARGCAHIGVFHALMEAGIPIDMVGGTSVGAAMAALYAMGKNYEEMLRINRFIWVESKPFNDYTLPLLSLISGKRFEHLAQRVYGETPIEDLWVNYFCVSANLTTTETVVHQEGPLWRALRATASLPGIAVPLIQDKNLLVDGGVLNNLPVDVMRDLCGGFVIAVNVSPERDLSVNFQQFPSPWKVLWDRVVASYRIKNVPNILDMLLRATMVGSIHQTNAAKKTADLYLQPPVERFKLLDFRAIDEIVQVGYEYTQKQLEGWRPTYR